MRTVYCVAQPLELIMSKWCIEYVKNGKTVRVPFSSKKEALGMLNSITKLSPTTWVDAKNVVYTLVKR